jgi:hypothetical protein
MIAANHYGLTGETLYAAHHLVGDDVALLCTNGRDDGLPIRAAGQTLGKLRSYGFIEIERANGHEAIARLTATGWRALCLSWRDRHRPRSDVVVSGTLALFPRPPFGTSPR